MLKPEFTSRVDLGRLGRCEGEDAAGETLVVIKIADGLFRPPDEIVAARDALDPDARRRELHEAAEPRAATCSPAGGPLIEPDILAAEHDEDTLR